MKLPAGKWAKQTLLAAFTAASLVGTGSAEVDLAGDLAVDLQNYNYSASLRDTSLKFSVDRRRSSHSLNLRFSSPLISDSLATISLNTRVFGTYFISKADAQSASTYIRPNLETYGGRLTLFPHRRYPLLLYHAKARDYLLRYEPNNRAEVEIIQPQLAVIRRYNSLSKTTGGLWRYTFSDQTALLTELRDAKQSSIRTYDFAEERNIWATFTPLTINPLNRVDTVTIVNKLGDADLLVLVDDIVRDTVSAMSQSAFVIDSGRHVCELVPLRYYNAYRFRITVRGAMLWQVEFKAPATPLDQVQRTKSATASFTYGGAGRLSSRTYFERTEQTESFQELDVKLTSLSNSAAYKFSRVANVDVLTTYTSNGSDIGEISTQDNTSFVHATTMRYGGENRFQASLMHSYNRNESNSITRTPSPIDSTQLIENQVKIASDLQSVVNQLSLASRRFGHRLNVKNTFSSLSDNTGYGSDQYSTTISNGVQFQYRRITISPQHDLRYAYDVRRHPDQKASELESKIGFRGETSRRRLLGDLQFRGEYTLRRRSDSRQVDTKGLYLFETLLSRKFGKNYRLVFLMSQQLETFNTRVSLDGAQTELGASTRPNEHRATYKVDLQTSPVKDVMLGGGVMLITQPGTTVSRWNLNLHASVPFIRIPFQSTLSSERRNITGLPGQANLLLENKLTYQIRHVVLVFRHSYSREKLVNVTYAINEIDARISRQFEVF
ncbi:MAG TPA: hypothetical protein VN285_02550 [Candidatus Deferrimicrobium sp.]|nr:hypothetical protein [Candidatus Deferrimicrobium sp.]